MDDDASNPVYAKTSRGRAELESRVRTLHGAQRTALILVDGRSPIRALAAKLGPQAAAIVDELLRAGYVERVEPVAKPARQRPAEDSLPPVAPPPAAPPPRPADLQRRQRLAIELLAPHFGPDVAIVCQPLAEAASSEAFEQGLDGIERKLAIYMGKAGASRVVAPLRGR